MSDPKLDHPNGWAGYEAVLQFMEVDGWNPQPLDGMSAYLANFRGVHGPLRVVAQVVIDREILIGYAIMTANVPEDRRPAVAELITRANYVLRLGNIEMDYADGEVRFRSSLDFEGANLTTDLIKGVLYAVASTMDKFVPAVQQVAFEGVAPVVAFDGMFDG